VGKGFGAGEPAHVRELAVRIILDYPGFYISSLIFLPFVLILAFIAGKQLRRGLLSYISRLYNQHATKNKRSLSSLETLAVFKSRIVLCRPQMLE
jgi:hypothetical protein